jgi:DNA-binding Xre family transcriptional regulator
MSALGTTINRRLSSKGNSAEAIRFRVQMAKNIRNAFGRRDITWTVLANSLGMTSERMSQINNAEVIANAIELTLLAKALGVSVDSLVEGCS